ncbi:MAG: hypothetical protein IJP23_03720 [Oscillospiraceae bacterium]|nr:hypothetical protein [Oscillospiraceae bacterium]
MLNSINALLEDGYAVLREAELEGIDRESVPNTVVGVMGAHPQTCHFAAMAQAFYAFLHLHKLQGDNARLTLLGDNFFALFSSLMIPLDSPWLIDTFAQRLEDECSDEGPGENYETFLKRTCKVYVESESEHRP